MTTATGNLQAALQHGSAIRSKAGGFPHFAEALRKAGVTRTIWTLPAAQAVYLTAAGPVVSQDQPLITSMTPIPPFDRDAGAAAIRDDQAGETTFRQFLTAIWRAGVIRYEVVFNERTVTYCGLSASCTERYPAAVITGTTLSTEPRRSIR